jgi:lipoyl synthase
LRIISIFRIGFDKGEFFLLTKPEWLKRAPPIGDKLSLFNAVKTSLAECSLHTVCEEAKCPNRSECWSRGTATFLIMGDICTRGCRFCNVKTGAAPLPLVAEEPLNLAEAVKKLGLNYVVITSVNRDDLPDQGAEHFAQCISKVKELNSKARVEVLAPDFWSKKELIEKVVKTKPLVFGHNLETVERLQSIARDARASYSQSLKTLEVVREIDPSIHTKSSLMLGIGEEKNEVLQTMDDLRDIGVDCLFLGQYLQPSEKHLPVEKYLSIEEFIYYKEKAVDKGFLQVESGSFVRSSYRADNTTFKE